MAVNYKNLPKVLCASLLLPSDRKEIISSCGPAALLWWMGRPLGKILKKNNRTSCENVVSLSKPFCEGGGVIQSLYCAQAYSLFNEYFSPFPPTYCEEVFLYLHFAECAALGYQSFFRFFIVLPKQPELHFTAEQLAIAGNSRTYFWINTHSIGL